MACARGCAAHCLSHVPRALGRLAGIAHRDRLCSAWLPPPPRSLRDPGPAVGEPQAHWPRDLFRTRLGGWAQAGPSEPCSLRAGGLGALGPPPAVPGAGPFLRHASARHARRAPPAIPRPDQTPVRAEASICFTVCVPTCWAGRWEPEPGRSVGETGWDSVGRHDVGGAEARRSPRLRIGHISARPT